MLKLQKYNGKFIQTYFDPVKMFSIKILLQHGLCLAQLGPSLLKIPLILDIVHGAF